MQAGSLGAELAAKAAPDGYTIVLGQDGNMVVGQAVRSKKNYDTLRDFAPISLVVRTPQVIVVNDASPLKSMKDLIAAAKAKPGSLTYATAGVAGSSHVLGAFFNIAAGIDTLHVPYKGGGPGMLDLRAGRVSYMITSMVSSLNFARDGRARLLAVTGTKRSHLFPDVPTLGRPAFQASRRRSGTACWRQRKFRGMSSCASTRRSSRSSPCPTFRNRFSSKAASSPAEHA